ncbi:LA_3696 family protein [Leptospira stimsonii]|uniref:DUF1640 domain-containing protein n=1 Tax=Leptospira stimsonii TaxID=2202203 RepID=A0A8B3CRT7_9LEPT|nr:DUF1640 domain-containing protein [Leptospira stimsonii]RHX85298.1 DUF1640 domain-containing protein [Leptospira stimsonii]
MVMPALVQNIPARLGEVLGPNGTVEFVDFLNESFGNSQANTAGILTEKLENQITKEASQVQVEITGMRSEFVDLRSNVSRLSSEFADLRSNVSRLSSEFADLRSNVSSLGSEFVGLRSEFSGLRLEFADLRADFADHRSEMKSEISEIHKMIATQTRWIFGAMIGLVGVFSIIVKF